MKIMDYTEFVKSCSAGMVPGIEKVEPEVKEILDDVRKRGDRAIVEYTRNFDRINLEPREFLIDDVQMDRAFSGVSKEFIKAVEQACWNIREFHEAQLRKSWQITKEDGSVLGCKYTPMDVVGVYVPGGTAPYPSTLLMAVVPAKVAGVCEVVVCTPPGKDKTPDPHILVAAKIAGVDKLYGVGGVQAIAGMAYGTRVISKVDKIVGPGNMYVITAKKLVYGVVDIEMLPGPSEIMIVADNSGKANYIAADLLSQAEHDEMARSVLVTTNEELAEKVMAEIDLQIKLLPRAGIARRSLEVNGCIVIVENLQQALEAVNCFAPEHLEIMVENPDEVLDGVRHAGCIFVGDYSPEPIGDYVAGCSHILPTGGTARYASGLNVDSFLKSTNIVRLSPQGFRNVRQSALTFAETEGFQAHANAVRIRGELDD